MNEMERVPFTEKDVWNYLEQCVRYWRARQADGSSEAAYYIDAYQSVIISLFAETVPEEEKKDV